MDGADGRWLVLRRLLGFISLFQLIDYRLNDRFLFNVRGLLSRFVVHNGLLSSWILGAQHRYLHRHAGATPTKRAEKSMIDAVIARERKT
jgi:hypothetical protein